MAKSLGSKLIGTVTSHVLGTDATRGMSQAVTQGIIDAARQGAFIGGNAQPVGGGGNAQMMQAAGKAAQGGGEAAGAEAGAGLEASALAGPVGIAIAGTVLAVGLAGLAVKKLGDVVVDTTMQFGNLTQSAARLDTGGAVDALENTARQIPLLGDAAAGASQFVRQFAQGLDQTAQKLSAYNAQLSAASAQAQLAEMQGNFRRAELLGPELSEFVKARSGLEQTGQDALAQILKPLIPVATEFFRWLEEAIVTNAKNIDTGLEGILAALRAMVELFAKAPWVGDSDIVKKLMKTLDGIHFNVAGIAEKGKEQELPLDELFRVQAPAVDGPMGAGVRPMLGALFPGLEVP